MSDATTISSERAVPDAPGGVDRRLLIDGQLLETPRTFPSRNPATGEVLGYAPDAGVADAEAAVAAARRAFDETDWSTNAELRIRCLEQFHRTLVEHRDELATLTIAEVGATEALCQGAQLDQPIEIVRSDPGTYMGPLISEKQRDKVDGMVKRAVGAGATLVTGGQKVDPGYFYTPTLLIDVDPNSEIAQEEVFGPVLVVIAYDDDDDAVRIANNSIYGLSGAVFGSQDRALAVARRIRTGTFSINGGNYFSPDSPFGGYEQPGIGREMGTAGLEEFLESKTFARVAS